MTRVLCILAMMVCGVLASAHRVQAHALEPGYLEITAKGNNVWDVIWRIPQVKGAPMPITARLPDHCTPGTPPPLRFDSRAFVASWQVTCREPISDGHIRIEGLEKTATDVIVRYVFDDEGHSQTLRLTPGQTSAVLPETPGAWGVLSAYFHLGIEHILEGLDHLLFVFALVLLVPDLRRLFWAITAFTGAHSLTLAASVLGWFRLPMPPVETIIALSIVFLATEIVSRKQGQLRLSEAKPWLVSFAFGLLHGLGFASALQEIGLPQGEVPVALLAFNLGVEAGQVLFVGAIFLISAVFARLTNNRFRGLSRPGKLGGVIWAYGIGSIAAFWTIERFQGFFA